MLPPKTLAAFLALWIPAGQAFAAVAPLQEARGAVPSSPAILPASSILGTPQILPDVPVELAPAVAPAVTQAAALVDAKEPADAVGQVYDGTGKAHDLVWDEPPSSDAGGAIEEGAGIRVLWWNIEEGKTNSRLKGSPLDANLSALAARPNRPHVIALGEFRQSTLSPKTRGLLRDRYDSVFLPYNGNHPDFGVMVFARRGLGLEPSPVASIDWAPIGVQNEAAASRYRKWWMLRYQKADNFTRQVSSLRVTHEGQDLYLVPFHALQPWSAMRDIVGKALGTLWTVFHLTVGRRNPLMFQATRLRLWLQAQFGPKLDQKPFLLFGDFNATRGSPVESLFASLMKRAFRRHSPSFPSASADTRKSYPPIQIDHAFVSRGVRVLGAAVAQLQGSDHYPVFLNVSLPDPRASHRRRARVLLPSSAP